MQTFERISEGAYRVFEGGVNLGTVLRWHSGKWGYAAYYERSGAYVPSSGPAFKTRRDAALALTERRANEGATFWVTVTTAERVSIEQCASLRDADRLAASNFAVLNAAGLEGVVEIRLDRVDGAGWRSQTVIGEFKSSPLLARERADRAAR